MSKEENFILFSDIKHLFFKVKWLILAGAIAFGGVGLYKRSQVPVRHCVSGVFKEVGQQQVHFGAGNFSSFLQSMGLGGKAQEGHVLLLSSVILNPVVEKLGLQAELGLETPLQLKKRRLKEAFKAERGQTVIAPERFEFEDVRYKGEFPQKFHLFFLSRELFEVRDKKGEVLVKGVVGYPVRLEELSFILSKTPTQFPLRESLPLSITPLSEVVMCLQKEIEVSFIQGNASLLKLEMVHGDRQFARRLLNAVMDSYKRYLESENLRVTEGQLTYLVSRRDEYMKKMDEHLASHVSYLKENLETSGALSLGQQLPIFQSRKQELTKALEEINLELSDLSLPELCHLQEELYTLSKERDGLMLSLAEAERPEDQLKRHLCRLDQVEAEILRVKTGVDAFFTTLSGTFRERDRTFLDRGILKGDGVALKGVEQERQRLLHLAGQKEGGLSQEYLKNQLRFVNLREGALKQRLFHGTEESQAYKGVDLTSARRLLVTYLQQRDGARSRLREMAFAKQQIEKEEGEWTSIAGVFPDGDCQELMREMGEIKKALRRERIWTEKEQERMEKKLGELYQDLNRHMDQIVTLAHLDEERSEHRIASVRTAILDLLGQEVSLIEQQIDDRKEEKLIHLEKEKRLLERQILEVKEEMKGVPDTWLREHRLKFAADMNKGMLEALVHLVESKSIEKNLSILESGPLDFAQGRLAPKPPLLKVFGLIGACLGALMTFALSFIYFLYKGMPLTLRNMKVRGKAVVGPLHRSQELEGFRRFSLLLKEESKLPLVALLVLGRGYDYTAPLAELLSKEGKKILVVDLNFKTEKKEKTPGLIPFLEGESEEPTLLQKSYGDFIPMGSTTPYGDEILRNPKFETFLQAKKKGYDIVLLSLPVGLEESLPKTFFSSVDVMALRLEETPFSAIEPYFAWESAGHSLAFV